VKKPETMSRKKKLKAPSAGAGSTDTPSLATTAEAALGASHYKDAIEQFKELLKHERRPAWLEALAEAYAGRAEQLVAKGMVKEALALWRTRSETCDVPLLGGPYVAWLLQSGQLEQALGLLATMDKLLPEAQALAQTQLAAAVLVAPDALLIGLPADSPVLRHRAAARAALAACAGGDEAALEAAVQAISFRSPYRDLRPLLKALAAQALDPQSAAAALARVSEGGPFEPLRKALQVSLMPGADWLSGLQQLDETARALVLDLKGCPQPQRPLVMDLLARAGRTVSTPLELFDVMLRHRHAMEGGIARQVCLRLLPHAPQRLNAFGAAFPLVAAEQEHVLALAAELKQQSAQAEAHWLRLVTLLGASPGGQQRAALVLRRLADQHARHSSDGTLCSHALRWLGQSLEFDPADRTTHLRLIRDARRSGKLKHARSRLDAACRVFPEDAQLLQEAVEIALAAGSFKKAAGLAKQVLKVDPINPQVRTLIGQAHLAHARKQIGAHNLPAARRELDEAASWFRGAGERGLVTVLQGFAAESDEAGDALLREAMALLGGPLVGGFRLLLEGKRTRYQPGRDPGELLRRAGVDLAATPGATDVVALAHALNALPDSDRGVSAALDALRGMLERAADTLRLAESDDLLLCEALHRHEQAELTYRFAKAALGRWPERPVFVYFEVAARFSASPWRVAERDWKRLKRAFDQARAQGDQRTASRLGKLLSDPGFGAPQEDRAVDADDLEAFGPDDVRSVLEMMLGLGGVDRFLDMARQELGKTTFERLRRDFQGSKKEFAQSLIEVLMPAGPELVLPDRIVVPQRPAAKASSSAARTQPDFFDE
jgi:tetratricopeptide (TPR) repeat protein